MSTVIRVHSSAWHGMYRRHGLTPRRYTGNGPRRALDSEEIAELRRLRAQGWRHRELAEHYGVTVRTVYRYLKPTYADDLADVVERAVLAWERRYALTLRQQERDSLVADIAHAVGRRDGAA